MHVVMSHTRQGRTSCGVAQVVMLHTKHGVRFFTGCAVPEKTMSPWVCGCCVCCVAGRTRGTICYAHWVVYDVTSHTHTHMRARARVHTRTRAHVHTCTRTRAHAHTRTRAHAHTRTRAHAHTRTHMHKTGATMCCGHWVVHGCACLLICHPHDKKGWGDMLRALGSARCDIKYKTGAHCDVSHKTGGKICCGHWVDWVV